MVFYNYILVFILIFLYVHVQFSAAEIAHQLASAEECNKLIVKKAVLDAGLQEYDTFVRSLFIVILIFTIFHLIIFCIISLLQLILDNQILKQPYCIAFPPRQIWFQKIVISSRRFNFGKIINKTIR